MKRIIRARNLKLKQIGIVKEPIHVQIKASFLYTNNNRKHFRRGTCEAVLKLLDGSEINKLGNKYTASDLEVEKVIIPQEKIDEGSFHYAYAYINQISCELWKGKKIGGCIHCGGVSFTSNHWIDNIKVEIDS